MLALHNHSTLATETELDALPEPVRRGNVHTPVPHGLLVKAIKVAAEARGYEVTRGKYALGRNAQRMFGVLDLVPPGVGNPEDRGVALGFRNSTNSRFGITVVAGSRVFVCDNLALSGDLIALKRRNTSGLDLEEAMLDGFDRFIAHVRVFDRQIERLQATPLTPAMAKQQIYDLFAHRVLPLRLFQDVTRYYFRPDDEMTDCRPRSLWGLHNSCTRALKKLTPTRAFHANIALGQTFGLQA